MANRPGNIKSAKWVAITALGFFLFLSLAIVLARSGKSAKSAVIVFADGLVTYTTDRYGNFSVTLLLKPERSPR